MVTYDDSIRSELIAQIDALGITRILLVGDLPFASTHGDLEILHDPGTTQALGEMTAFQFTSQVVDSPEGMVKAVADVESADFTELKAAWEPRSEERRVGKEGRAGGGTAQEKEREGRGGERTV